ncbi:MAG: hypothetical protein K8953_01630, partial [Proteobacteria bacterium]|nr:hypothetical protein [Pseudomonadota bacterium]
LIGADGAIGVFTTTSGVFSYAGGFTARPFALTPAGIAAATPPTAVDVNVLQDYATLPTTGSTTAGGFLKFGNTLTNANSGTFIPTGFSRNVDVASLRNDIEDIGGVTYLAVTDDDDTKFYYYAGIFADTDLGAPRTDTAGTASWTGQFLEHASGLADKDDFVKFHIDFGRGELQFRNAGDTAGNGTLVRGDYTYTLNARFGHGFADANNNIITTGQLGGQITRAISGTSATAVISGLIGEKGVVGAFVNTADRVHFAGGFWAVPVLGDEPDGNDEVVDFSDWEDSFGRGHDLPRRFSKNPQTSEFLAGRETVFMGVDGLDDTDRTNLGRTPAGANFAGNTPARFALDFGSDSLTYGDYPLGADATGGAAGFWQASGSHRYAGLLSSTNVGAPISETEGSAAWRGRFVVYRAISNLIFTTQRDFTLNVTFGTDGGTLAMANITDSQTPATHNYSMTGGKYDERGVISGKINFHHKTSSTSTTILTDSSFLTGLIGQDGAAGVFISGTGTIDDIQAGPTRSDGLTRFFGGFVATGKMLIDAPASPSANHEQFNWYYKNYGSGDRKLSATFADSGATVKTAFVAGTTTGLNLPSTDLPRQKNLTVVKLHGDESSSNGFAFVSGNITLNAANERFRVGLLSDTDLGAVFASAPELLTWTGSIHLLTDAGVVRTTNRPFTLDLL